MIKVFKQFFVLFIILFVTGCTTDADVNNARTEGYNNGYSAGLKDGKSQGYEEGLQKGRIEGRDNGFQEGRQKGLKEGRETGYSEGLIKGNQDGYINGKNAAYLDLATISLINSIMPAVIVSFILLFISIMLKIVWRETIKHKIKQAIVEIKEIIVDLVDLIFNTGSPYDEVTPESVQCSMMHKNSLSQIFCRHCSELLINIRSYTRWVLVIFWWLATVLIGLVIGIKYTAIPAYIYIAILLISLLHLKMRFFPMERRRLLFSVFSIGAFVFIFAFYKSSYQSAWLQLTIIAFISIILFDLLKWTYQEFKKGNFTGDIFLILGNLTISLLLLINHLTGHLDFNIIIFGLHDSHQEELIELFINIRILFSSIIVILILLKSFYAIYGKSIRPASLDILPVKEIKTSFTSRNAETFFIFNIFTPIINLTKNSIAILYNVMLKMANILAYIIIVMTRFLWLFSQEILSLIEIYLLEIIKIVIYFLSSIVYPLLLSLLLFYSAYQISIYAKEFFFNSEPKSILCISLYIFLIGASISFMIKHAAKIRIKESIESSFYDIILSVILFFILLGISSLTLIGLKKYFIYNLHYEVNLLSLTGFWVGAIALILMYILATNRATR